MKIAGIYAQKMDINPKLQHMYGQPTGLLQLLGTVEKHAHETQLFYPMVYQGEGIFVNQDDNDFVDEIVSYAPDVVAFSIMTAQYSYSEKIAKMIKNKLPSCFIVAGGRHPSFSIEDLQQPFDLYIIGEGEITFLNLITAIDNNESFERIEGIAYRKDDGTIIQTGKSNRICDLDNNSILKRDDTLLELVYKGISIPSLNKKPKYALIEYSRGCAGKCEFCDNSAIWGSQIYRSANTVVLPLPHDVQKQTVFVVLK